MLQLGSSPHQTLAKLSKTYDPLMSLHLGSIYTVVSFPEMAKHIFQINISRVSVPIDGVTSILHAPFLSDRWWAIDWWFRRTKGGVNDDYGGGEDGGGVAELVVNDDSSFFILNAERKRVGERNERFERGVGI
ncbi:hypothetical protein ACS0TY_033198 [Phlomoides rotata]